MCVHGCVHTCALKRGSLGLVTQRHYLVPLRSPRCAQCQGKGAKSHSGQRMPGPSRSQLLLPTVPSPCPNWLPILGFGAYPFFLWVLWLLHRPPAGNRLCLLLLAHRPVASSLCMCSSPAPLTGCDYFYRHALLWEAILTNTSRLRGLAF